MSKSWQETSRKYSCPRISRFYLAPQFPVGRIGIGIRSMPDCALNRQRAGGLDPGEIAGVKGGQAIVDSYLPGLDHLRTTYLRNGPRGAFDGYRRRLSGSRRSDEIDKCDLSQQACSPACLGVRQSRRHCRIDRVKRHSRMFAASAILPSQSSVCVKRRRNGSRRLRRCYRSRPMFPHPKMRLRIVQYRQDTGSYKTLDDLRKVRVMDTTKIDANKQFLEFQ